MEREGQGTSENEESTISDEPPEGSGGADGAMPEHDPHQPIAFPGDDDDPEYFEKLFAFKKAEDDKKREAVTVALGKFNVFLHLTAYIAGVSYLLLLGVLYRPALPWVFIPVGLWTVGIAYHFYRAFSTKPRPEKKKKS